MRVRIETGRRRGTAFLTSAAILGLTTAGCGSDYARQPKPPLPVQLTGVITPQRVTIEPNNVGAGPVIILISNQTQQSHTITLAGQGIQERVGPVNPFDTATIQKTLPSGRYTVMAGSEQAEPHRIKPARLRVGRHRRSGSEQTNVP